MPSRYFQNFPEVYYNGQLAKDISRRVKFVDTSTARLHVFHAYDLEHGLRSDLIADYYYDDSYMDWMIYVSNYIVDPYYQWYLDDEKFGDLMIQKYGSIETSMKKVKYYRNNWSSDYTELEPSFYYNTLDQDWKKYYEPVFGAGQKIISFKRKAQDITINTNRILDFTISANNGTNAYSNGELLDINTTGTNTVGTAELIFANSSVIRVQHVSGNTSANSTATKLIIGETSGANMSVNAVSTVKENVTSAEEVFWSPVYYYDWEQEINESNKSLILLDAGLTDLVYQAFVERLREDVDPLTNRLANT